jgi:hypothetical protein
MHWKKPGLPLGSDGSPGWVFGSRGSGFVWVAAHRSRLTGNHRWNCRTWRIGPPEGSGHTDSPGSVGFSLRVAGFSPGSGGCGSRARRKSAPLASPAPSQLQPSPNRRRMGPPVRAPSPIGLSIPHTVPPDSLSRSHSLCLTSLSLTQSLISVSLSPSRCLCFRARTEKRNEEGRRKNRKKEEKEEIRKRGACVLEKWGFDFIKI